MSSLADKNFEVINKRLAIQDVENRCKSLTAKLKKKCDEVANLKSRVSKLENILGTSPRGKMQDYKLKYRAVVDEYKELLKKHGVMKVSHQREYDEKENIKKAIRLQLGQKAWEKVQYYTDKVY